MDYGQIEFRVIAALAGDEYSLEAIRSGLDVHMYWAKWIVQRSKRAARLYADAERLSKFRSMVKNELVFPAFYGSQPDSIKRNLNLPDLNVSDLFRSFWVQFKGIRSWQKDLLRDYEDRGYVQCLNGRRRYGPLTENQIFNTPVQGTASDIVVNSMVRLFDLAVEKEDYHLAALLNVHDDLTFSLPRENVEERIAIIVREMVRPVDGLDVPLSVEVTIGPDWYHQSKIGNFSTEEFY